MSCRIYQRTIDERSGRTVEELIAVLEPAYAPDVALSIFFADENPLAGTYTAECDSGKRRASATVTYNPRSAG